MDVRAVVSVGTFTAEAHVEDCGPDALADAVRQVVVAALSLVGEAVIKSAVTEGSDGAEV